MLTSMPAHARICRAHLHVTQVEDTSDGVRVSQASGLLPSLVLALAFRRLVVGVRPLVLNGIHEEISKVADRLSFADTTISCG